ncbi:MAG TPA: glycosyltransferase family 4 protein [Solirubrobacterales bacterium]|nr:glycosyltransferase family 4 protein [Solirubrobacterales bacterium]
MQKTKVLYVLHNHPALFPGGAEAYALELYETLRESPEFEPLLVARIGSNIASARGAHPGAPFSAVGGDPNQYFLYTQTDDFDSFKMTSRDKNLYTQYVAEFIEAHKPDIVHFQHTLFIGYDLVSAVRRMLPDAPLFYTLHEFIPICHRDGQMFRTNGELCTHASPRRCNECFPAIPPQDFFLRERFIKLHLDNIDMFLAPSRFLLERYVDWGIPRERIRFEDYGRIATNGAVPAMPASEDKRNRVGFFGQLNYFKGVDVLLEAMALLGEHGVDAHLTMHGANLQLQPQRFRDEFDALLGKIRQRANNVTLAGEYVHDDLPRLMAEVDWVVVPSRWWENSPLVIQEAFQYQRPVICSDIGGMAEKVTDGVDGLHFRAGDPRSLARVLERAATTPALWESLRAGIPGIYDMQTHIASLGSMYREELERRQSRPRELAT